MDDLMPCDMAFTAFLESMTASRLLRATRPKFRGDELAIYRECRQVRRRAGQCSIQRKSSYRSRWPRFVKNERRVRQWQLCS